MIQRVLLCGAWDEGDGYPRTAALRQGLQAAGVAVGECRTAGPGRGKQRLAASPWRWPGWWLRSWWRRRALRAALRASLAEFAPEVVVVPYPGHHLVADVARIARVPVVLDLFLSAYDTAVVDRGLFAPSSWPARLLRELDRRACHAADLVLVDTAQNAAFVAGLVQLPHDRFAALPIGDPQAPPVPVPVAVPAPGQPLRVLFFGTGVPLHGLRTLIDATAATAGVNLVLIGGTASDRDHARQRLGARLELGPEFVDRRELQAQLDAAHVVAGVFGTGDKAGRVVPFKVVHALASGRPVVTADTVAVRAVLDEGDGVFLVPAGDATALAARLSELAARPAQLATAGVAARAAYDRCFCVARSGRRLCELFEALRRVSELPS